MRHNELIKSKLRSPGPVSLFIDDGASLTSTGAVNVTVPFLVNHVDFSPSSFRVLEDTY